MASGSEYATRDEVEAVRRDLRDTERLLRDRDDEKERILRAEFVQAINESDARHDARFDKIDNTLDDQTEMMKQQSDEKLEKAEERAEIWPNFWRTLALFALATIVATLALHFGFGVG